jgi:hypothetical protein
VCDFEVTITPVSCLQLVEAGNAIVAVVPIGGSKQVKTKLAGQIDNLGP